MFSSTRSSKSIFDELVTKALSIASVQEVSDSSIKRIVHRVYNPTESQYVTFKGGRGVMSDGLHVNIPNVDVESYNVLTNITLSIKSHGEIAVSNVRFGNNLDSVFVYVNGLKVPDSSIHLYMTSGHTNIIIPKSYFTNGDNNILIEKRRFNSYTYGGTRVKNFTGKTITFPISAHRDLIINKNTCMVFHNGCYLQEKIFNASYSNGIATITLTTSIVGDVEVFVDSSIAYRNVKSVSFQNGGSVIPFNIDDSFIDPLYGPINNDNCLFFIDGKRISNLYIDQTGRLNFETKLGSNIVSAITAILFTDNGIIKTDDFPIYSDDYYLYNFIGSAKVTQALAGAQVHPTFDKFVNYRDLLGKNLSYERVMSVVNSLKDMTDNEVKIMTLIENFPNLLRDFLEFFSNTPIRKTITYTGTPTVTIGFDKIYDEGTRIIRIITVNGRIAKIDKLTVTDNSKYWQSTVDGKWFVNGVNEVDVVENIQIGNNVPYKVVEIDRYETTFTPYAYRAVTDVFSNIAAIDDFKVLAITKRKFDEPGIYFKDSNYGFRVVSGVECPRMVFDGKIWLDFGAVDPRIDMLVITTMKHHDVFNFNVNTNDVSYDALFNELYIGTERFYDEDTYHDVKIPLIHNGSMIVCDTTDGIRMFRGIDYLYKSQIDITNLRNSGLIFKRSLDVNNNITVVVIPDYTQNLEYPSFSIDDTGPNKYGLLYLGNLKFPYSPKYVEVFANNKRITSKDINTLSSKLIRLYKEEVSLQNVYVEANFSTSFTQLRPFMQLYSDSDFEINIGKMFACYNFYNLAGMGNVTRENADLNYESFDIGVDSNGKTPNPVRSSDNSVARYDLYIDAYLRWFISDRSNHIWNAIDDIPEEILLELEIFRDSSKSSRDVVIFSHKKELVSDIVLATMFEWYPGFTIEGTVRNFLDCCVENGISIQECYDRYNEFKYSNRVFKQDLVPISALQHFDGEDIIIGRGLTTKFGG